MSDRHYDEINVGIYECRETGHTVEVEVEGEPSEFTMRGGVWKHRDAIEPPKEGFTMFADSASDINVPFLLNDVGLDPEEIIILYVGHDTTVWRGDSS